MQHFSDAGLLSVLGFHLMLVAWNLGLTQIPNSYWLHFIFGYLLNFSPGITMWIQRHWNKQAWSRACCRLSCHSSHWNLMKLLLVPCCKERDYWNGRYLSVHLSVPVISNQYLSNPSSYCFQIETLNSPKGPQNWWSYHYAPAISCQIPDLIGSLVYAHYLYNHSWYFFHIITANSPKWVWHLISIL